MASSRAARLSVLALMFPVALSSVVLAVLIAWPYEPFSVYDARVRPPVACPGEEVETVVDLSIDSGSVRKIEVESSWRPVDSPEAPESGGSGTVYDPGRTPRTTMVSPVTRAAPEEPGTYRLHSETDVVGTFEEGNLFHGFPRFQRLVYESNDLLRVLPEGECGVKK